MIKRILIITLFIVLLFSSVYSHSRFDMDDQQKNIRMSWFMAGNDMFDGYFILKFKDQIKLTVKQQEKVEKTILSHQEFSLKNCAETKIRELRLASYIKSDKIDRDKIEKTIREISKRKTEEMINYTNYVLDLREILTSEQIKQLKEIRVKLASKIKQYHRTRRAKPADQKKQ